MEYRDVVIVGGGPAGSSCAWKLKQYGIDALILDKQSFPRTKLCAGWITPAVLSDLEIGTADYPHGIVHFNRLYFHIAGITFPRKTDQYSIRRVEFDYWLLQRSGAPVVRHRVQNIRKEGREFVIDDHFRCRYLVGAGGTHCPVYEHFFKHSLPRDEKALIVTMEEEFPYHYDDKRCHLWFFENGLVGYSWYVPKADGYINVGIGGFYSELRKKHENILFHWNRFTEKLQKKSLVCDYSFHAKSYVYYIRSNPLPARIDNAFITGDAVGLATTDMGEGIGPAIQSGIMAAVAIARGKEYDLNQVRQYSGVIPQFAIKILSVLPVKAK